MSDQENFVWDTFQYYLAKLHQKGHDNGTNGSLTVTAAILTLAELEDLFQRSAIKEDK